MEKAPAQPSHPDAQNPLIQEPGTLIPKEGQRICLHFFITEPFYQNGTELGCKMLSRTTRSCSFAVRGQDTSF